MPITSTDRHTSWRLPPRDTHRWVPIGGDLRHTLNLYHSGDPLKAFQQTHFYKTIVQNNLFQPLGTTPTQPRSAYTLLGTTTPPDGRIGGKAFIQHTEGDTQKLLSVTLGERLGNATVVDIQPKQVILDAAGIQTTLKLQHPLWLKK